MFGRRLLLAALIGCVLAELPSAAAASPDLYSLLVPPAGASWSEEPPQALSLNDAASEYVSSAQAGVRSDLTGDGFQTGYDRAWDQKVTEAVLDERVLRFGYSYGAANWFAERRDDDRQDPALRRTFSTGGLPDSFGYFMHYSDDETELGFYRGLYYYELTIFKSQGAEPETVLTQARLIYARTPPGTSAAHDPEQPWAIAMTALLVAACVLLAVAAMVTGYALWSLRTQPAAPADSPPA